MMLLIVTELCQRYGSDSMLFRVAYYWKYKKEVNLHGDLLAWRTQRVIPQYVCEFISVSYDKK